MKGTYMKQILLVLAVLLGSFTAVHFAVTPVHAQVGIGFVVASSFSTTVAGCPASTVAGSAFLCIVVPGGTTQPSLALSVAGFNSGAPFAVVAPAAAGVTSFNGRTGAVVSASGDYSYSQLSSPPTAENCPVATLASGSTGAFSASGCTIK